MNYVPPTPDCKGLIARGFSASDLGWSQTFYERFCWQYGLAPVRPKECVASLIAGAVKEEKSAADASAKLDPFTEAVHSKRWNQFERREVAIEIHLGARRSKKMLHLRKREACLLLALTRTKDGYINASEFCSSPGAACSALSKSLTCLPIELQRLKGVGCRLIYTKTKEAACVRITRIGEIEIA